jgi:integrase/recombinase XerD
MEIENSYFISIYLDTRVAKKGGKYPVKLRIFTSAPRKQKLYSTGYEFTESEFNSVWESRKPKKEHKDLKVELQAIEAKAHKIAKALKLFNFEDFERLFLSKSSNHNPDVVFYYNKTIDEYNKKGRIGTASNYKCSLNSLLKFHKKSSLDFYTITPHWLEEYEQSLFDAGRSSTTISMYLRSLRSIFNMAIKSETINKNIYPFGSEKYTVPNSKAVKKALSKEQFNLLLETEPTNECQIKAKDFWFFSFYCNGMNIKDIALLKPSDIKGNNLTFYRAKIKNTKKSSQTQIDVVLTDFARKVIEKYSTSTNPPYLFPIISKNDTPLEQHTKIKAFTRFINQHMKKFAKSLELKDIEEIISTYWARHTFASAIINGNGSIGYLSKAMGHSNPETTINYVSSLTDEYKQEMANILTNF